MIRSWLKYLLLVLITMLLMTIFSGYLFFVLFLIILCIPVISIVAMYIGMRHFRVQLQVKKDGIYIECQGGTLFPIVNIRVDVQIENVFYEEREVVHCCFLSGGKKESLLLFQPQKDMGRIRVRMNGYEQYDMVGFLHRKVKQPSGKYVILYPPNQENVPQEIDMELSEDAAIDVAGKPDISGFMEDKHEVREYREGDSLHYIHHKLSYKLQKTMVREFTAFHQEDMLVYLDFSGSKEDSAFVFSSFASFGRYWVEKGLEGIVHWSSLDGEYEVSIHDERVLRMCLNEILSHPKKEQPLMNVSQNYAHTFVISAKGITSMNQSSMKKGGD